MMVLTEGPLTTDLRFSILPEELLTCVASGMGNAFDGNCRTKTQFCCDSDGSSVKKQRNGFNPSTKRAKRCFQLLDQPPPATLVPHSWHSSKSGDDRLSKSLVAFLPSRSVILARLPSSLGRPPEGSWSRRFVRNGGRIRDRQNSEPFAMAS